jgi:D-sedoheptulose 7-phosphate isomerase
MQKKDIISYNSRIGKSLEEMRITDKTGTELADLAPIIKTLELIRGKNKMMIVGNGGSASIAQHYAQDFTKIGKILAINFNDPSLLTMVGNDFSHEEIFSQNQSNGTHTPETCL